MSIAIMQPYVFPYIGYFQLVYAADVFVFYDDVNFINRGWINRNRILLNGKDQLLTIPCKEASQNKLIKEVELVNDPKVNDKLLATIVTAYKKAPCFTEVFPLIEKIILAEGVAGCRSVADMAIDSVVGITDYLGIKKVFKTSSEEYNNRELRKADRLIDICHLEGITDYINAQGGKEIYTKEYYRSKGVNLNFLVPRKIEYKQWNSEFAPYLSMIDVLMFNSKEHILEKMLPLYDLE